MFDFPETLEAEKFNSVPQEYQGLYQEGDNGYTLVDHAKPLVESYKGVLSNLEKANAAKKQANEESAARRTRIKGFQSLAQELGLELGEDDDLLEGLKSAVEDLRAKAKNGENVQVDLDKVKKTMQAQQEEALGAKDKEIQGRDKAIQKYLVDQKATAAVAEAKGSVDLLLPHIRSASKVVQDGEDPDGTPRYVTRILDADGEFRTDGKGDYMDIGGLVAEMRNSEKFARAFESEEQAGSGARPGASTRPTPAHKGERSGVQKIADGLGRHTGAGARRGAGA